MMDGFEYKGTWWLPDEPEKRVAGILRFTPDEGAILELIDTSEDIEGLNRTSKPEIILGISLDGENITLHKCYATKLTMSSQGFIPSVFHADEVFVGVHFQKSKDIKFRKLSVHYSYLDEWVSFSAFTFELDPNKKEYLIKYRLPEPIKATIDEDFNIFIVPEVTYPLLSIAKKEASIKQATYISIEHSTEKSLNEYWRIIYQIQFFLSLGIATPVYPLSIIGTTEANKRTIYGDSYYIPIKIYYQLPKISDTPKTLHPHYMLFTFRDISDKFEALLKNWFKKVKTLRPVYDLYFRTLYNPWMYLQHQFLSLIQAIEAYHRRKFEGKYLSDDDYKPVYKKLKEFVNKLDIESSFKDALKSKLKYGNEYSLRKRLKDLFEKYKELVDHFIKDKDTFINKVVDTRNYLTHYDRNLKKKVVNEEQLYYVTQQLKILVVICLLSELGFDFREIKKILARHRNYKDILIQQHFQ